MRSALLRTARLLRSPLPAFQWGAEFIDDRITTRRHLKHLEYYASRRLPVAEGISEATGVEISEVEQLLANLPEFLVGDDRDPGMTIRWSATSELAATTYALVRMLKPEVMVETGVGAGVSSWTILHAMEENGSGKLVSIDLPTPNTELLPEVGYLVPQNLRHRWDLQNGASKSLLPKALNDFGQIDIFQHDSRHSYSNQLREYTTAWPFIREGGMLISDDVSNDSLYNACRQWGREPSIIGQSKESPIGLVGK